MDEPPSYVVYSLDAFLKSLTYRPRVVKLKRVVSGKPMCIGVFLSYRSVGAVSNRAIFERGPWLMNAPI